MSNIARWDPMQEMLSLREAMNQLFEDSYVRPVQGQRGQGQSFAPAMDVSETSEGYTVEAAVPGLKPDNIEITLENNVLTIRGETKQESTSDKRQFHRVERRYGSFQRSITLPTQVQGDAIKASLEHGVLRLDIPKAEAVKPRKISVNVNSGDKALEVGQNQGQSNG